MTNINKKVSFFDKFAVFFNLKKSLEYSHTNKKPSKCNIIAIFAYYIFIYAVSLIRAELFKQYKIMDLLNITIGKGFEAVIYNLPLTIIIFVSAYIFTCFEKTRYKDIFGDFSNIFKSILLGLIVSAPMVIINLLSNGYLTVNIWSIIFYFVCISLFEEFLFRGFFQPRVEAIFDNKHKWISYVIVGWMCGVIHLPNAALTGSKSIMTLFLQDPTNLGSIAFHIGYSYLSTRFNNILPAVILHFFLDLK